jgi:pilus assembly protein CpaF
VQVVLHVGRDRTGNRRLTEIALLSRGRDGWVRAQTAWHVARGFDSGADRLAALLDERGVR